MTRNVFVLAAFMLILAVPRAVVAADVAPAADAPAAVASAAPESPITDYRLPPEQMRKAEALYQTETVLLVVGSLYGIAALLLVLYLRIGSRYRDIAEKASSRRFVQALVFVPLMVLTLSILDLPLGVYGHHLGLGYGLSVQGWGSWFWDWTKGQVISVALSVFLFWGLYAILRRSPRRWWLYGWMALVPVVVLLVFAAPVLIQPLFSKFDPLEAKQPQLVGEIEKVVQRGGLDIARSRMFEMQASEKVTTYNAYVAGIGPTKRVVVWDNTARALTTPEVLFVYGHEQGHYVLGHIWLKLAAGVGGLLVALYLAHRTLGFVLGRWGARWGVRDITDWASLPVLMLVLGVFQFAMQPIQTGFSRLLERRADVYGLEVVRGIVPDANQAAARAFQKLGEKGLVYPTPSPVLVFLAFSHPPIAERIRFATQYRPWETGQSPQYVK